MLFYTSNTFIPVNSSLDNADVIFLGIPYTDGSIAGYSKFGPVLVRESLKTCEDFINSYHIFDQLELCDAGDIEIAPGSYEENEKRIISTIEEIKSINSKAMLVFVGGNHTITLPISKALKPATIVQLDAHADLREAYLGSKYMQQSWGYHASQLADMVQLGIRASSGQDYMEKARQIGLEDIPNNLKRPLHLTLDMDVFDPSLVKVGFPEPSGLSAKEVLSVIERLKPDTMDVVEISDSSLPSNTAYLAANCILRAVAKASETGIGYS